MIGIMNQKNKKKEIETQKKEFETEKNLLLNKIENSIPIPTSWVSKNRFIFVFNYKTNYDFQIRFLVYVFSEGFEIKREDFYVIKNNEGLDLVFIKLKEDISIDKFLDEFNFTRFDGIPIHLIPFIPSNFKIIQSGKNCVLLEGLNKEIDVKQMFETFGNYGKIIDCHIPLDSNNQSLGYCFIHFLKHSDGEKCISDLCNARINGNPVKLRFFDPKDQNDISSYDYSLYRIFDFDTKSIKLKLTILADL